MVKQDGEVKMLKNPLKNAAQIQVREPVVASKDKKKAKGPAVSRYPKPDSDVDKYIPVAKKQAETTFAFIICNENYPDAPVPYSLNDGRMFREYCQKTLGIPENHINLYEDATFGNIITAVEKMKSIAEAYDGEASVISIMRVTDTLTTSRQRPICCPSTAMQPVSPLRAIVSPSSIRRWRPSN